MGARRMSKLALFGLASSAVLFFGAYWLASESGNGKVMQVVAMGRGQEGSDVNSLTGRVPIWKQVIRDISEQPLMGYGYGSFWTPERVLSYSRILNWEFNHAHSAYLETMLNIGAIGLALGMVVVARALWLARKSFAATEDCGYWFVIAILTLAPIQGLLDSNFVTVGFAPIIATLCISLVALHDGRVGIQPLRTLSEREFAPSDGPMSRQPSLAQA
jgi:O-antigen ligase